MIVSATNHRVDGAFEVVAASPISATPPRSWKAIRGTSCVHAARAQHAQGKLCAHFQREHKDGNMPLETAIQQIQHRQSHRRTSRRYDNQWLKLVNREVRSRTIRRQLFLKSSLVMTFIASQLTLSARAFRSAVLGDREMLFDEYGGLIDAPPNS
jgi:hypothetical protein